VRAQDYGNMRLSINGQALSPDLKGYSPQVAPTEPISFGRVALRAGVNSLVIEIVGKEPASQGFSNGCLVGIDGFLLRRVR
jgi:hypothetical protein